MGLHCPKVSHLYCPRTLVALIYQICSPFVLISQYLTIFVKVFPLKSCLSPLCSPSEKVLATSLPLRGQKPSQTPSPPPLF